VHAPHRDVHQFNVRRSHRAHVKPPVVTMHNTFATPQILIRRTAQALPCAPATITRSASHGAAISTSAAMTTGRAATSIAVTGRAKPLSGDQVRHDLRDLWVQHSLVAFWDLHRRPKLKPCPAAATLRHSPLPLFVQPESAARYSSRRACKLVIHLLPIH
jgi:hypothetical protein